MVDAGAPIEQVRVGAWRVPTDQPESDGTHAWDATVLVLVHVRAAGREGLGWTYADTAAATLVRDVLAPPRAPPVGASGC